MILKKQNSFRVILIVLLVILSLLSIRIGVENFTYLGLIKGDDSHVFIAFISRLPRTLAVITTGIGLSVAGLIMQTITNNKFVSPSTAGTMEWCRFGVLIAILFTAGQSTILKVGLAFIISLLGTFLFMILLQKMKLKNALMVPLIGMMLGSVVSSITTFVAYKYELVQNMTSWLQANFSLVIKGNYEILYLGIPCIIIAYIYAHKFTIAGMGETFSTSLGLNHNRVVLVGLVIVSFITSLIVVSIGSISFVGLIIPNIVSMFKGDNVKGSLLDVGLLGSVFLLICDLIGRVVIAPYEVNVSVIVSVLGSFIFLALIIKKRK